MGNSLGKEKLQVHNLIMGLSYAIIPQLSLGINMHYIRSKVHLDNKLSSDVVAPDYGALKPDGLSGALTTGAPGDNQHPYGRNLSTVTIDVGLTLRFIDNIGIAVVGYNLTNLRSPFAPMMLGMGAFAQFAIIHVAFDVLLPERL